MQIYHVETQEDYDALGKDKLPGRLGSDGWLLCKSKTGIFIDEGKNYRQFSLDAIPERLKGIPIQKYKAKQNDVINSPNHYTQGEYEVIDILEDKLTSDEFMGFLKGNVTKYNFRELYKNQDEDIAKAEFYQKKMKEFVAKGKAIYSRIAKRFTKVTGYEFDNEFIKQLESGELKIVRTDDGSWVNDPTSDIY